MLAGIGAGTCVGVVNGIGVAVFNVSPFMMTLGMASIGFGIALYLTGGVPVYGMPDAFGDDLRLRRASSAFPSPVYVTAGLFVAMYILLNWTRHGTLLLRGRRQPQGLAALRHQHPVLPVHGLCAVRRAGRHRGRCC